MNPAENGKRIHGFRRPVPIDDDRMESIPLNKGQQTAKLHDLEEGKTAYYADVSKQALKENKPKADDIPENSGPKADLF